MAKNSKKTYEVPALELLDLMSYESLANSEEDDSVPATYSTSGVWGDWV